MKKITCFLALMLLGVSLIFGQTKTGTLKIFSELTEISVYVDEIKQTTDPTALVVPVGSHYLKVLYQNTSVYGEIIEIKENLTTTILIKNTGQVQEKVMETKTLEREEYQNSKIDVLLSSTAISSTSGKTNYYPGFYGYYGYTNSNTVTTNVSDFKIIQGGVKEIGDIDLASLVGNQDILNQNANYNTRVNKQTTTGAIMFLGSLAIGIPLLIDVMGEKHFLHPGIEPTNAEIGILAAATVTGIISYCIIMGADKHRPSHWYNPDVASKDAQSYNKKLKGKLGLPESYDVK